ncbi:energy transducer TonB [Flavivirga aquimarina]|uniref:Energy transducer TonB n=1 Tax=Flavivirga aquimarina TaxID=2027862 RepID=A0ABT8WBF8_9FLAO|nr:energy transducer TonB [Flavivirga aquimarina]MDO5970469.1 energy transducer TonB [Flavivirga aquimarina]
MEAKKNPKLEIGRNSSIYFAIGLNLMLLLSWQGLEYKTYEKNDIVADLLEVESELEEDIPIVNINTPPPPPPPVAVHENIQIVEDVEEIEETVIESTETSQDEAIRDVVEVSDVEVAEVEEDVEVPFSLIENVPVFPGCEGKSKKEMKDCFQQKVQEHVVNNFRYPELALEMGLQGRVSVIFVINSQGYITGIRSRGPDKILEKEAERIIGILPRMKPGTQRGKPVKVAYSVPIFFKFNEG